MRAVLITDADYKKLHKLKQKDFKEAYKKFSKRKKTHLSDFRLAEFYKKCTDDFNPMLYTIPFNCYFTLYLYLFLKKQAERFDFDQGRYQFLFSKPFKVNVSEIARIACVPLNTVKSAFRELVHHEFLLYTEILSPIEKNQSKTSILANDHFIIGYDKTVGKTCFYNKLMKFTTAI